LEISSIIVVIVVLILGFLVLNTIGSIIGTLVSILILSAAVYFLSINDIVVPRSVSQDMVKLVDKYYTSASDEVSKKKLTAQEHLNKTIDDAKREISITGRKAGDEVSRKIQEAIR